ncbi:DUF4381 domain-containing protein [Maricurvus nonylphenolicus]|uniref:DUF4381 domain-containing protein n=1 Tax=Maricurvus nonylphenolicus TaxID=1008307 RepID=UPI0036F3E0A1
MASERPDFLIQNFGNDWLSNMHEINLPGAISWLPQGAFWQALLLFVCVGIVAIIWRSYLRYCSNHYRRQAVARLQKIDLQWRQQGQREKACRDLALLVRRVALTAWPRKNSAALVGQPWLDFLQQTAAIDTPPSLLPALSHIPAAQLEEISESQWSEIVQWVSRWLAVHQADVGEASVA